MDTPLPQDKKPCKRSGAAAYQKTRHLSVIQSVMKTGKLPRDLFRKDALRHICHKLYSLGVLKKLGYATYSADIKKYWQFLDKTSGEFRVYDTPQIRGHGFHWTLALSKPLDLAKLKDFLNHKNEDFIESRGTWKGVRILCNSYKVWFTKQSIVIYCPEGRDFNSWCALESSRMAYNDLLLVIGRIEALLGSPLRYGSGYAVRCSKQHYARVRDAFAKLVNAEERYIQVAYKGEQWLVFDRSRYDELETVNPASAIPDQDEIVRALFNGCKEYAEKTGQPFTPVALLSILQMVTGQTGVLKALSDGQMQIVQYFQKIAKDGSPDLPDTFQRDSSRDRKLGDYIG
jgi:hypothetical protein